MGNKPSLNPEQKEAFKVIQKFLDHPGPDTFVLKGYAGTGKTFLMQHLATWLTANDKEFCLLASTGRASTVLKGKTGFQTRTVHSELYHFSKVDGDHEDIPEDAPIDQYGQMKLQFKLRAPDQKKRVYIIDESSMLSSEPSDESIAAFGSGILLGDFFDAVGANKIIFVGDPCQLPPVKQTHSPSLDMDWLASQGRTAISMTLELIERTKNDNDIPILAMRIRHMLDREVWPHWPKIPAYNRNNVKLYPSRQALFNAYIEQYKLGGGNNTLAIARSNAMVQILNNAFRKELYKNDALPLQLNEILLVNRNNYKIPLTNGDFVTIISIGELKVHAGLHFQNVKVRSANSEAEHDIFLSLDILYGDSNQFTREQNRILMIDFSKKMKKQGIKANTSEYKESMMKDDFLNCLQATYGYFVTCHKAQGGEWDNVFLFLDKSMFGMPRPELFRWWYTAITRAKKELNLENEWWIGE
ncbi:MAG TPA: ATP-dependent RecD-like DNA helicase [Puia sp.]|nr:ATP-dependent RecD-like DNA helicase [Puia sp.]